MKSDLLLFWARGRELDAFLKAAKLLRARFTVSTMAPGIRKGQNLFI